MLHLSRILFVAFIVAVLGFAWAHYEGPLRISTIEKRLVPMRPKAGGAPGQMEPAQPTAPMEPPLFTVDIERIPEGYFGRGTSFPLGNGLWLTARHVANEDCGQIILVINGENVEAQIKFLDPNADLAVLQTPPSSAPPMPIDTSEPDNMESAYAFGFPHGMLGGTQDQFIGRARMRLGGRLNGTAPVLTWSEVSRFPDDLDTLTGISGGPMLDTDGNVVGIIVAASSRRGRNYTVAPEILSQMLKELGSTGELKPPIPNQSPAREIVTEPVSLDKASQAMKNAIRIAQTYCVPRSDNSSPSSDNSSNSSSNSG